MRPCSGVARISEWVLAGSGGGAPRDHWGSGGKSSEARRSGGRVFSARRFLQFFNKKQQHIFMRISAKIVTLKQ